MQHHGDGYDASTTTIGHDPPTQTLVVPPSTTVNLTTQPGEHLVLTVGEVATVNMQVDGSLTLDAKSISGTLDAHGGTIHFAGTNLLAGPNHTVLDDNLTGSGTLTLTGDLGEGTLLEVGGHVGSGLTVDVRAASPVVALQIDQPRQFHAAIDLPPAGGLEYVAFMGLHATQADLIGDILLMFNGGTPVDAVRINGGSNLQLQQNQAGVILSEGVGNPPGGSGTAIPLHSIGVV